MPVTVEQNIAIKRALRKDLRPAKPGEPTRWFYRRTPWVPAPYPGIPYVEPPPPEGEVPPVLPPDEREKRSGRLKAIINIATAVTHEIIPASVGRRIRIFFATFTVGGEVNVTMYDGPDPFTGAMDFGGLNEPRGIVLPQDGRPILFDNNHSFSINLSAAVQVSGFVIFDYV